MLAEIKATRPNGSTHPEKRILMGLQLPAKKTYWTEKYLSITEFRMKHTQWQVCFTSAPEEECIFYRISVQLVWTEWKNFGTHNSEYEGERCLWVCHACQPLSGQEMRQNRLLVPHLLPLTNCCTLHVSVSSATKESTLTIHKVKIIKDT